MTTTRPRRQSKNEGSARTSLWLTQAALKASAKKAAKLGITRGKYLEQLIRRDTGLSVRAVLDERPSVFG